MTRRQLLVENWFVLSETTPDMKLDDLRWGYLVPEWSDLWSADYLQLGWEGDLQLGWEGGVGMI